MPRVEERVEVRQVPVPGPVIDVPREYRAVLLAVFLFCKKRDFVVRREVCQ